jgi:hypothetical protein
MYIPENYPEPLQFLDFSSVKTGFKHAHINRRIWLHFERHIRISIRG